MKSQRNQYIGKYSQASVQLCITTARMLRKMIILAVKSLLLTALPSTIAKMQDSKYHCTYT